MQREGYFYLSFFFLDSSISTLKVFTSARCVSFAPFVGGGVVRIQSLGKDAFRAFLKGEQHALDAGSWGQDECFEHSEQLLHGCVDASSQDREDEVRTRARLVQSNTPLTSLGNCRTLFVPHLFTTVEVRSTRNALPRAAQHLCR